MTSENPPCIGVDHKDWMVPCIQEHGIGGFGANAMKIEQFFPKLFRWIRKDSCQRASVPLVEKRHEKFQPLRLLAKISGRTNLAFDFTRRSFADSSYVQQSSRA